MIAVYEILNKVNKKRYIGSSKEVKKRFKVHLKSLLSNNHYNSHLQHAWNKYGEQSFEFNIIKTCSEDKLLALEKHYIDTLNVLDRKNGYNVAPNPGKGASGIRWSQKSKDKLSKTLIENYASGKRSKSIFFHTLEAKKLISKASKGHIPVNRKKIWCHQTGIEYCSLHGAAKMLKISVSGVCDVLTKRIKSCKGYSFEYANESNKDIRPKVLTVPQIICIETDIIYDTQTAAAKSVNGKSGDLGRAIKKGRKFKGFTFRKVK